MRPLMTALAVAGVASVACAQTQLETGAFDVAPAGDVVIGYYTDNDQDLTDPEAGIIANGATPVQILTLTGFDFFGLDALVLNETDNTEISDDVLAALPAIEAWVEAGGKLIVHDRYVSSGVPEPNPFLIGDLGILAVRDFSNDADIDVLLPGTKVTEGSFGTLDSGSLDGGNSSCHGYVPANTRPDPSHAILNRGGAPTEIVSLAYPLGDGAVFYSTIPLDYYLAGNGPNPPLDNMTLIYYPNVIEYMLTVGFEPCDADLNGDFRLDILDFVTFQLLWQAADPAADCNGDGFFDTLDFVCFQELFQQGCN